jgi:hypothetical protein
MLYCGIWIRIKMLPAVGSHSEGCLNQILRINKYIGWINRFNRNWNHNFFNHNNKNYNNVQHQIYKNCPKTKLEKNLFKTINIIYISKYNLFFY